MIVQLFVVTGEYEMSNHERYGPRMWVWVHIPLLTACRVSTL